MSACSQALRNRQVEALRLRVKVASRKLTQREAAATLEFLKSPPGNRLAALAGDRQGQHGIRVNDQWRICFRWTSPGPQDVEIVDYQ